METIYKTGYWTETLDEARAQFDENEAKLQAAISLHAFFSSLSHECFEDFSELARLCLQLASYEDAEFALELDANEKIATMQLTAPCFLFQVRQLMLLQKLSSGNRTDLRRYGRQQFPTPRFL